MTENANLTDNTKHSAITRRNQSLGIDVVVEISNTSINVL